MSKSILTQEKLKEYLSYDKKTGVFTWLKTESNRVKVGDVAGTTHSYGYIIIGIFGKQMKAHRLAWLYEYGKLPTRDLDHENEIKSDNRICNLRLATNSQNMLNKSKPQSNSSTNVRGVYFYKDRFCAKFKRKHLGIFNTIDEAKEAYLREKEKECQQIFKVRLA